MTTISNDMYMVDDIDYTNITTNEYNIIPNNTYWLNRIIYYMNNQLYHDEEQLTNIQYYRILDFLNSFI
jgi:hypothetical protein